MITILAGGTGSVKLVRGFAQLARDLAVVCNVGDNIRLNGLYICPDIDTIVYGLAGILDTERGWGIRADSFELLKNLESLGGESWFRIGDKDLATHLARTTMLAEGHRLLEITSWICSRLGVKVRVMPATEDHLETRVITDDGEMHLQEFWVKHRAEPAVKGLAYSGADVAEPLPEALNAIEASNMIVVAPANPVSSIGPILAMKRMREALAKARERCIAVSPIVGSEPVSGPAAKYMGAVGIEVSPYGVAKYYSDVISKFVLHSSDVQRYGKQIEDLGIKVHHTDIMMRRPSDETRLASYLLALEKSVRY